MLRKTLSTIRRFFSSLAPSEPAWHGATKALWWLATLLVGSSIALTFGSRLPSWGELGGVVVLVARMLGVGLGLWLAFLFLQALPSVYRRSALLLSPLLVILLVPAIGTHSAIALVVWLAVGIGTLGGVLGLAREHGAAHLGRPRVAVALVSAGLLLVLLPLSIFRPVWLGLTEPRNPALIGGERQDLTLALEDPGMPGPYRVETLTYGSGEDRRRPEFGSKVDVRARSVDGSRLVDGWEGLSGKWRTAYWGFDAETLPLQGRVFMPKGVGPYPLVLFVHGNHWMEVFSDEGYRYLGELLASRGAIFVSIDQNFLNSSIADLLSGLDSGLDEENDLRGWLLLEHVRQWQDWNVEVGHRLEGKVDDDRVILVGHSRGGEAVATAAAFHRLSRYPDDARVQLDYRFNLRGIAALAPVDGQYRPREKATPVVDVDYMVLHGSLDGDVQSFMGSSVFERARWTGPRENGEPRFKAGVYLVGGNHGQFNTSWGACDYPRLWCWSLDTDALIAAEDQRRVAQVYLSSFVEAVAHDRFGYRSVFEDSRHAAAWLPSVPLISNYQQSDALVLADYEEDLDLETASYPLASLYGEHLTRWSEQWPALKWEALGTHVAQLAWDDRRLQPDSVASYTLRMGEPVAANESTQLVFALADANVSSLPDDEEAKDQNAERTGHDKPEDDQEVDQVTQPLDWTVELVDGAGVVARLPLSYDSPLYPGIDSNPSRLPQFNELEVREIVLRRFALPLSAFAEAAPALDLESLHQIRFVFDRSPRGTILVDDIRLTNAPARQEQSPPEIAPKE